jgi:hypothetical protein
VDGCSIFYKKFGPDFPGEAFRFLKEKGHEKVEKN